MKLYQLENGTLLNLDQFCVIEPAHGSNDWLIVMSDGSTYNLTLDDVRNLMDQTLLGFEFMAE